MDVFSRYEGLRAERQYFEPLMKDVCDFVAPARQEFQTKGKKRANKIFSSVPARAANRLANVLNSMLTPRSSRWIRGKMPTGELSDDSESIEYTERAAQIIFDAFNASNFHTRVGEAFYDYVTIGTPIFYMDEDFWFDTLSIWDCYIDEDVRGVVDTLFRKVKLTKHAIIQKFGEDALTREMREEKNDYKEFELLHAVYPSDTQKGMPFKSVWVDTKEKVTIFESGYYEFPFFVPRWTKYTGEKYARTPAMEAMADIKNLHSMTKCNLRASRMIVDPPLDMEQHSYTNPIKTGAGDINVRVQGSTPLAALYVLKDLPIGLQLLELIKKDVNDSFFYDQLTLVQQTHMTEQEVWQRTQENMKILGPTYDRLEREWLIPMVQRGYGVLVRAGKIAPPPPQLRGEPFTYESPLARAQRLSDMGSIQQSISVATPIIQMKPEVMDNIDLDSVARTIFRLGGVESKHIKPKKLVDAEREIRAEQMRQQQQLAMAQQMAATGKDASEAMKNAEGV